MKYKYILCDADDTLLDFAAAERQAFSDATEVFGIRDSDELYARYHDINDSHWKKLELGLTTRERLKVERFSELFSETGILPTAKAEAFSSCYLDMISKQDKLLPNVEETLSSLYGKYKIYIVTNGTAQVQHGRLDRSPLMKYVSGLFISEELGAAKPSHAFFDRVLAEVGDYDVSAYIVVGDSPSSDIKGAVNYGMDSCLIIGDREYGDFSQTYTVKNISQILDFLL